MIDQYSEQQLRSIIKRALDLYYQSKEMLAIDGDFFENRLFQSQKGVFVEIGTDNETISSLGNLYSDTNLLENISFVLFNVLQNISDENITRLQNKELHLRIWIVDSHEKINQFDTERFFDKLIIDRPGIIINENKENSFCFLPKIWDKIYDPAIVMSMLSKEAHIDDDDWKDPQHTITLFKSHPITI